MLRKKIAAGLKNPLLILPYLRRNVMKLIYNMQGTDLPPREINIGVNNICNARCKTCDYGQSNKDAEFYKIMVSGNEGFDSGLFRKLLDEVKGFKPKMNFVLVEPLLAKNICELISMATKEGLKTYVITNGFILEDKAEGLAEAGLSAIQVSLDGPPELNDKLRGLQNGFEKAMKGARKLRDSSKDILIRVNFTVSNLNYGKILETLEEFKKYSFIDEIQIENFDFVTKEMAKKHNDKYGDTIPSAPSCVSDDVDPKKMDVNVLFDQIKEVKNRKYLFKVRFVPNMKYSLENLKTYYFNEDTFLNGYEKCAFLYNSCYVSTDGTIRIHSRCYDVPLGDINGKSFLDIWNSEKYKGIRKSFYNKAPPACSRCCGVMFNM